MSEPTLVSKPVQIVTMNFDKPNAYSSSPPFKAGPRCHNPETRQVESASPVCVAAESLW